MHILYVSQYFPPEIGAPAVRVSELSRRWVEAGHKVTVLTGFPNHPTGEVHPDYRRRFRRLFAKEKMDGIEVVRCWLIPLPNRKPYERVLNYSSFCLSATMRGLLLSRPDVVIATSPQLLVGLAGLIIARLKRVRFVLEIRDIWPDAIIASGVGSEESLLARTLAALSRFLYRKSDHIVVVTSAFDDELVNKWAVPKEKISVIQNGVETDVFFPPPLGESTAGKSDGRFVVSYIGTLGLAHGLSTVIEAAKILQRDLPNVMFLLVGEGADKDHLVQQVDQEGLANVHIQSQQPRVAIPDLIRASAVCLVLLKQADIFKTVIPTKMLEFMSCGRPVIVGVDGQARAIIEEAGAGIYVEPENATQLVKAIKQLHQDPSRREALGRSGHEFVTRHLSRKSTAMAYLDLLNEIT